MNMLGLILMIVLSTAKHLEVCMREIPESLRLSVYYQSFDKVMGKPERIETIVGIIEEETCFDMYFEEEDTSSYYYFVLDNNMGLRDIIPRVEGDYNGLLYKYNIKEGIFNDSPTTTEKVHIVEIILGGIMGGFFIIICMVGICVNLMECYYNRRVGNNIEWINEVGI